MIQESFSSCGIFPYNLSTILPNCKTKIDLAEEETIKASIDGLVDIMREKGKLFDADFDAFNIRNNKKKKKDNLVLNRRRCVLLTSHALCQRELEKKEVAKRAKMVREEARVAR